MSLRYGRRRRTLGRSAEIFASSLTRVQVCAEAEESSLHILPDQNGHRMDHNRRCPACAHTLWEHELEQRFAAPKQGKAQ
jgi:hypothetical protein